MSASVQRNLPGFSLTELLMVIMIAATLGTVGLLTYEGKVENIRHANFDRVKLSIAELVTREYDRIIEGKASTLIDPTTNRYAQVPAHAGHFCGRCARYLPTIKTPMTNYPPLPFPAPVPLITNAAKYTSHVTNFFITAISMVLIARCPQQPSESRNSTCHAAHIAIPLYAPQTEPPAGVAIHIHGMRACKKRLLSAS